MEERGVIIVSAYCEVFIPKEEVWMTMQEISDMLGVLGWHVRNAIGDIYKNGEMTEAETKRHFKGCDGYSFDAFSLEMVVAISFKIPSKESIAFREYILERLQKNKGYKRVILKYDDGEYSHILS